LFGFWQNLAIARYTALELLDPCRLQEREGKARETLCSTYALIRCCEVAVSNSNLDCVVTGCITKSFSQLNPHDSGGQYDSSGGAGGKGNPAGSVCTGFNHYVEVGVFLLFYGLFRFNSLNRLLNLPVLALASSAVSILLTVPLIRVSCGCHSRTLC